MSSTCYHHASCSVSTHTQGALALIYVQAGSVTSLLDFLGFATWLFHALTMLALLILRKTMPDERRPFKVVQWKQMVS